MRLRELRKARGISQLKLAMDLNTNQNTISRYETGEREPGITELIALADYFDVSGPSRQRRLSSRLRLSRMQTVHSMQFRRRQRLLIIL